MTTITVDANRIEAAARALLDEKVAAVRVLAAARQAREDQRAALTEAERNDTAAYTAALRAGWTADELKRVGLDAATKRAPGRPRSSTPRNGGRSTAATHTSAPETPSEDSHSG